jgi:DNA-binding transcriptional LysR family regulator
MKISQTGISLERIETFCRIAEEGSIAVAADKEPNRQSQYSRQLKDLETAIGSPLFDRKAKPWQLTREGTELLAIASGFFQSMADLQDKVEKEKAVIRIGAGEAALNYFLIPKLAGIRERWTSLRFRCQNLRTMDIAANLLKGDIDIGIIRSDAVEDGLEASAFSAADYFLFVPRQILPGKSGSGLELLHNIPMATLLGGGALTTGIKQILSARGIVPNIIMEADSTSQLLNAVKNLGVAAVLPSPAKEEVSEETVAVVQIEEFSKISRELVVAYNPAHVAGRRSVERLIEML